MKDYESFFSQSALKMRESAIRQMGSVLAQARDMISFAPGYPAEDLFPWELLQQITHDLLESREGSVLQYGPTHGYQPLREATVDLMKTRHINSTASDVLITSGSQQGLDLVARVLLDPGDVVLMELPSYTGAITAFRNVGASMVGVRQEADGIDLDHLEHTMATLRRDGKRVKVLYLVPNFQNPTGLLLALKKRLAVLEWAAKWNVLVVEDDPYRDLYFPDVTKESETRAIAADDNDGRVIYLSSFSKTVAPGLRMAWVHAPRAICAKFELAKQASDLCTGNFDQRIIHEVFRSGLLDKHLPKLREHYQHKRDAMVGAIGRHLQGRVTWAAPRGGFFLWVALSGGLKSIDVMPHAREHGVIYVDGSAFFVDGSGQEFMRLSFSAPSPARIDEGVARLAAAVAQAQARGESVSPAATAR